MHATHRILIVLVFAATCGSTCRTAHVAAAPFPQALPGAPDSGDLNIAEYQQELDRWLASAEKLQTNAALAEELRKQLPDVWRVSDGDRHFIVSTHELRAQLMRVGSKSHDGRRTLADIRNWLQSHRREAGEYDAALQSEGEDPAGKLREILRRREFRGVGEPSYWELLIRRVQLQLLRFLEWLFRRVGASGVGDYLIWLLIALLVSLLVVLLLRTLHRGAAPLPAAAAPAALPAQNWRQWLAQAEALAAAGDFRAAVHAGYWSGLAWLEERGALAADRTRTPRENLRLLPVNDPRRVALRRITERMEITWYGYDAATTADFGEVRARLEELGCPLHAPPATAAS